MNEVLTMAVMQIFDTDGYVIKFESDTPEEERQFFVQTFPNVNSVVNCRLHCTSCNLHIGAALGSESTLRLHSVLRVTQCTTCHTFYSSIEFNNDLRCRWCGHHGEVYRCSKCPFVFCKQCIVQNLPIGVIELIEQTKSWNCFNCSPKIIWTLRATHWAHSNYLEKIRMNILSQPTNEDIINDAMNVDPTNCCREDNVTRCAMMATRKMKRKQSIDRNNSNHLEPYPREQTMIKSNPRNPFAFQPVHYHPIQPKPAVPHIHPIPPAFQDPNQIQQRILNDRGIIDSQLLQQRQLNLKLKRQKRNESRKRKRQQNQQIEEHSRIAKVQFNSAAFMPMQTYPKSNPRNPFAFQPVHNHPIQPKPEVPHIHPLPPAFQDHNQIQQRILNVRGIIDNQLIQQRQLKLKLKRQKRNESQKRKRQQTQQIEEHLRIAKVQFNRAAFMPMQTYPKNELTQARNGLESQILSTQEVCKETIDKLNGVMLSNNYKNVRNYIDVKEQRIHVSFLQKIAICRIKAYCDNNHADIKKLNDANEAENYKSDDDDLEMVENSQVLIDLVSQTENQRQADSSTISEALDQETVDAVDSVTMCVSDDSKLDGEVF